MCSLGCSGQEVVRFRSMTYAGVQALPSHVGHRTVRRERASGSDFGLSSSSACINPMCTSSFDTAAAWSDVNSRPCRRLTCKARKCVPRKSSMDTTWQTTAIIMIAGRPCKPAVAVLQNGKLEAARSCHAGELTTFYQLPAWRGGKGGLHL